MSDEQRGTTGDRRTPVPDPTELTTDALHREVNRLEELLTMLVDGKWEVAEERFNAIAEKFSIFEGQRIEQKSDTKEAVAAALQAAKEAVTEQTMAGEKAISKSEDATTKEIDGIKATFGEAVIGLRRDIDETRERILRVDSALKERLSTMETTLVGRLGAVENTITARIATVDLRIASIDSKKEGGDEKVTNISAFVGTLIGVMMFLITIGTIAIAVASKS